MRNPGRQFPSDSSTSFWFRQKVAIRVKKFSFPFQNGYPARRRSLVDDARFETLVVKQTKQTVLDEARQRANGKLTKKTI